MVFEAMAILEQQQPSFVDIASLDRARPRCFAGGEGDQKRIVSPRQARDDGASVLVIGRPISRAEDPVAAARQVEATL